MNLAAKFFYVSDIRVFGKERADSRQRIIKSHLQEDESDLRLPRLFNVERISPEERWIYFNDRVDFYETLERGEVPKKVPVFITTRFVRVNAADTVRMPQFKSHLEAVSRIRRALT